MHRPWPPHPTLRATFSPLGRRGKQAPRYVPSPQWGERLSFQSSVLPWFAVSNDGVEDGEQFSHGCDDGDDFGFAGGHKTVAEGLEAWVMPAGDEGGHEQHGPHLAPAASNEALALPCSRL